MTSKPWYANGLRFTCTRCGNCCRNRGGYSYVYLTPEDVAAIAGYLELPRRQFLETYCTTDNDWVVLRMDRPACAFLKQDNTCAIYPVRPKQCATWPFWKENLKRAVWESEVQRDCPGAGKGELHSREEIERIARENAEWYGE
jgi:Fe-S-cluster containining protein